MFPSIFYPIALCFVAGIVTACSGTQPSQTAEITHLRADTLMYFKVGDRFQVSTSENSCCLYCWVQDSVVQAKVATSPLIKLVEVQTDPADPDCAGCSEITYYTYECVRAGRDSLQYVVIPMGDLGARATLCDSLKAAEWQALNYRFVIE